MQIVVSLMTISEKVDSIRKLGFQAEREPISGRAGRALVPVERSFGKFRL